MAANRETERTAAQSQTCSSATPHQIPHFQRLIFPHAQRDPAGGVDVDMIDPSRVALERFQKGPVGRAEEGDRAVYRGGEEVLGGGEVEGCYGAWWISATRDRKVAV